jgi:RNA polymerase sigma-70 factor (ECF subfamily)
MKLDSPEDFNEAYEKYCQPIYRFLYWQTKDPILSQDLTSMVFERAWKSRRSFAGGSVQAWLYRISRNLLIDHWRKKKDLLLDDLPGVAEAITDNSVTYDYDSELEKRRLSKTLDTLPDEQRSVVVLRFIDGLPAKEVGEILGLSEGNVRIIQFRALKRLKEALDNEL